MSEQDESKKKAKKVIYSTGGSEECEHLNKELMGEVL